MLFSFSASTSENEWAKPRKTGWWEWHVTSPHPLDPNEIAGLEGIGEEKRYVMLDTTLEYTVYFKNVKTSTMTGKSSLALIYSVLKLK